MRLVRLAAVVSLVCILAHSTLAIAEVDAALEEPVICSAAIAKAPEDEVAALRQAQQAIGPELKQLRREQDQLAQESHAAIARRDHAAVESYGQAMIFNLKRAMDRAADLLSLCFCLADRQATDKADCEQAQRDFLRALAIGAGVEIP